MKALGMGRDVCWITGPNYRTQAEMKVLAGQREVMPIGRARPVPGKPGLVMIPYLRLAPAGTARKRVLRKRSIVGAVIGVYALAALALAWEARYVILQAAGVLLLLAAVWWVSKLFRHGSGCSGMHCPCCRG